MHGTHARASLLATRPPSVFEPACRTSARGAQAPLFRALVLCICANVLLRSHPGMLECNDTFPQPAEQQVGTETMRRMQRAYMASRACALIGCEPQGLECVDNWLAVSTIVLWTHSSSTQRLQPPSWHILASALKGTQIAE